MPSSLHIELEYPRGGRFPRRVCGEGRHSARLESTERGALGGRHTYLAWDPHAVVDWHPSRGWRSSAESTSGWPWDPFEGLAKALGLGRREPGRGGSAGELPSFRGGAVGYFAYELATTIERLPELAGREPLIPLARWALADVVLALDHERRRAWAFSSGKPKSGLARRARARERLDAAAEAWRASLGEQEEPAGEPTAVGASAPSDPEAALGAGLEASLDRADYGRRFDRLRRHLLDGHLYQANLTIDFAVRAAIDPVSLHRELAVSSPVPHAALLAGPELAIVSASPELFLARRGRRLVTRPIKGTRPRGATESEDAELAQALLDSPKDRAEHVMIVDVHRNDLGRVAEFGTVRVRDRWALESFAALHHLTSTIEARERRGLAPLAAVRAAFPAGSITGAPKIRAMQVLAELEPHARGVYTGALGWIGDDGDFELAVGIRTATVRPDRVDFPAGGGIVLDSDPDAEYREAWDKARSMWAAVTAARRAEVAVEELSL